jgi:hypothetical protein
MTAFTRVPVLAIILILAAGATVFSATMPAITVSPSELKLVTGNPDIVKVTANFAGPWLVGLVHDGCWNSPVANITGWKSDHTGGALVTSSSYTVFLQAGREPGECTLTFEAGTLHDGRTTQTVHVSVSQSRAASITISPANVSLDTHQERRVVVTANETQSIALLHNTCGGSSPIAAIVNSATQSSRNAAGRTVTLTLDLLGRRNGTCMLTFFAGSNVTQDLIVRVNGPH